MKKCKTCNVIKPLESFYKEKSVLDGRRAHCADCMRADDKRKESMRLASKKWKEGNPERYLMLAKRAEKKRRVKKREYDNNKRKEDRCWAREKDRKANESRVRRGVNAKRCMDRKAAKLKATPKWADLEEIKYIYGLAVEKGLEVDHRVPLRSDTVCGLHAEDNLRCIPRKLNRAKSNKYWSEMWDAEISSDIKAT